MATILDTEVNMTVKAVVRSLEDVADTLRDEYEQRGDGRYYLKLGDDLTEHPGVLELKGTMIKEREQRKTIEKQLKEFQSQFGDVDPHEALSLLEEKQRKIEDSLLKKGELDKLRENINSQWENKYKNLETKEKASRDALTKRLFDLELKAAKASLNVRDSAVVDFENRVKSVFQFDEEQQKFVGRDAHGNVLFGDGGMPLTVSDWGKSLKHEASHLFVGDSAGGGRTPNDDTRSSHGGYSQEDIEKLPEAEQLRLARAGVIK